MHSYRFGASLVALATLAIALPLAAAQAGGVSASAGPGGASASAGGASASAGRDGASASAGGASASAGPGGASTTGGQGGGDRYYGYAGGSGAPTATYSFKDAKAWVSGLFGGEPASSATAHAETEAATETTGAGRTIVVEEAEEVARDGQASASATSKVVIEQRN
jgi:hypothetical protein